MALPFSAAHLADHRRRFLSTLTGEELRQLAADLQAAVAEADAKAAAAQAAADGAQAAADGAQTVATGAQAAAEEAQSALEEYATQAQLAAAVSGLASESYVDGKFAGTYSGTVVLDGQSIVIANGLVMSVTPVGP